MRSCKTQRPVFLKASCDLTPSFFFSFSFLHLSAHFRRTNSMLDETEHAAKEPWANKPGVDVPIMIGWFFIPFTCYSLFRAFKEWHVDDSGLNAHFAVWGAMACSSIGHSIQEFYFRNLLKEPRGTDEMYSVAEYISYAILRVIKHRDDCCFNVPLYLVILFLAFYVDQLRNFTASGSFFINIMFACFFVLLCSICTPNCNPRIAAACYAYHADPSRAYQIALRGGICAYLSVASSGVFQIALCYAVFGSDKHPVGVVLGSSFTALYFRVGHGIHARAAAEIAVGKTGPKDADVIARSVGECFVETANSVDAAESLVGAVVAAAVLGGGVATPLLVAPMSLLVHVCSLLFARYNDDKPMFLHAMLPTCAWVLFVFSFNPNGGVLGGCTVLGLVVGILIELAGRRYCNDKAARAGVPVVLVVLAVLGGGCMAGMCGVAFVACGAACVRGAAKPIYTCGPALNIAHADGVPEYVRSSVVQLVGHRARNTDDSMALANGAAVLSSLSLVFAVASSGGMTTADITKPAVVLGFLAGPTLPCIFKAIITRALGDIINWASLSEPVDPSSCFSKMLPLALLAFFVPFLTGVSFGSHCLVGFLTGSIFSGYLLAVHMCTDPDVRFGTTTGPAVVTLVKLMVSLGFACAIIFYPDRMGVIWQTKRKG
eukprot:TRINITY_DN9562_c0_g1_i1.p1 TRINITY_DN9562_c0_g1~~TRINITY_DN9562_c0_g1_i1.p1  ORF type:complete len:659 (+),score=66.91 TRINITY_DN9562_c0_g1_i1:522-2498(+)